MALPMTTDSNPPSFDGPEQLSYRIFEPPSGLVLTAILRHKLIVFICAILVALAGAAFALHRKGEYTASATVQVGQVNPNSPGFYSYVESAAALATAFSRAVSAEPVLATVQQKLKVSPTRADAKLSAEPIPDSPIFRVAATGESESAAVQLANVTANALIAYESATNSANPEAASLLHEYNSASLAVEHADAKLAELEASTRESLAAKRSQGQHPKVNPNIFAADRAARNTATARLKAIDAAYTAAVTSQAPRTGLLSLLAAATSATSNKKAKVEKLGFIGLLAGIVIGCILAVLRERIHRRRRAAAAELEMRESAKA
jgi:capsular polysaccharide biosynthesis protein